MKTRQWWGFACRENGEIDQEMHGDPRREMDGSNKDLAYESPSDTVVAGPLYTAVTATMGWTSWHESHKLNQDCTASPWRRFSHDTKWKGDEVTHGNWLLVWNMRFMTFHILGIVTPTDYPENVVFFLGPPLKPLKPAQSPCIFVENRRPIWVCRKLWEFMAMAVKNMFHQTHVVWLAKKNILRFQNWRYYIRLPSVGRANVMKQTEAPTVRLIRTWIDHSLSLSVSLSLRGPLETIWETNGF